MERRGNQPRSGNLTRLPQGIWKPREKPQRLRRTHIVMGSLAPFEKPNLTAALLLEAERRGAGLGSRGNRVVGPVDSARGRDHEGLVGLGNGGGRDEPEADAIGAAGSVVVDDILGRC